MFNVWPLEWLRDRQTNRHSRKLKDLNLYSMEECRFRGDRIETFEILKGLMESDPDDMFRQATRDRTRNNRAKLRLAHSGLKVRRTFSAVQGLNKPSS